MLLIIFLFHGFAAALWPIARSDSSGTTPIKLSPEFDIHLDILNPPSDLVSAVSRTISRTITDSFQRLVVGRSAADARAVESARTLMSLVLSLYPGSPVRSIVDETNQPVTSKSEGYSLSISTPSATLVAQSTLGLLRGLATFEQLWYDHNRTKYLLDGGIEIVDQPAFPYLFKEELSLNVLYWHVIDSQSFPLDIRAFPELAEAGAYSSDEIYTQKDIQRVVQYANERGVDVVMELDSPGHTTAIGAAYPEHIACASKSPWSKYASEPPAGQLRIASPATVSFAETLFDSVASMLPSKMMSSGGDEVNLPCWEEDEQTQADLAQRNITIAEALNGFVQATPFIKSDMVLTHNVPVVNDTLWQTSEDAASVAERNLRFIHQPSNYFYLDCGAGEWLGNDILGNSWCDPFKTWQRAYSFDPFANLTQEQHHLVLGGQMPLWSEQSSPENLDSIVWPRLAVAAEVFWTGETLPDGTSRLGPNVTSGRNALARLNELRYRLVDRGVNAIALQPKWCALRPGECDLDS
ncbi:N-acetylhexosaminidase [Ganoderma leucocontextum]|nr:N-acetylhexosaminidase [Ganoderma leucocontextum]